MCLPVRPDFARTKDALTSEKKKLDACVFVLNYKANFKLVGYCMSIKLQLKKRKRNEAALGILMIQGIFSEKSKG